jgi:hypothetical protein
MSGGWISGEGHGTVRLVDEAVLSSLAAIKTLLGRPPASFQRPSICAVGLRGVPS